VDSQVHARERPCGGRDGSFERVATMVGAEAAAVPDRVKGPGLVDDVKVPAVDGTVDEPHHHGKVAIFLGAHADRAGPGHDQHLLYKLTG
jgi:hypothetical protein